MMVAIDGTFESWQHAARDLLRRGVAPDEVTWIESAAAPSPASEPTPGDSSRFVVPRRFVELARAAATHPNSGRWTTMYRVLWRLVHENRGLLDVSDDPDVRALVDLQPRQQTIPGFELEPPPLVKPEQRRTVSTVSDIPAAADLGELGSAAESCTRCELYKNATQTVFGRGPSSAPLVLVGEQPGDQEDLQGAPFVGPAGEVLDRALAEIGLDRRSVYITNIVKHFKWEPRGKRRIHMTPRANEIHACRPWLEAELGFVKPRVIVCLGSTAAQALIGATFRITRSRGQFYRSQWAPWVMGTYHPSAVLRAEDPAGADAVYRWLVEDLRHAAGRTAETEPRD
ncbi:MAG TPA: UdgX family uracil-DNA binding protein [Vicinamibacterales bacterium]|jgi:DNA polymerase|nr:UdgX family uracil-DNA binding protein [Vicinamibacterales bacterium]